MFFPLREQGRWRMVDTVDASNADEPAPQKEGWFVIRPDGYLAARGASGGGITLPSAYA